jgi:hypothetical protein
VTAFVGPISTEKQAMNSHRLQNLLDAFRAIEAETNPASDAVVVECYHLIRKRLADMSGASAQPVEIVISAAKAKVRKLRKLEMISEKLTA